MYQNLSAPTSVNKAELQTPFLKMLGHLLAYLPSHLSA